MLYSLFDSLSRRAQSLAVRDANAEVDKLALIRIATGVVALARVLPIVYGGYFYFPDRWAGLVPEATALGAIVAVLLLLLTLGLFTPLAIVALLILYSPFEGANQSVTLGSVVLTMILLLLGLTGAGSRRSLDGAIMGRRSRLGRFVAALYSVPGKLDESGLRVVYLLLFVAFGIVSLGAVILHLNDSYWREGYTLQVMFTSSYLSRGYPFFRELEAAVPGALRAFSIVGSTGQALFQFLMIPLVFTRAGGWFVILWGLNFFIASALLLELSYLPYLELLLWGAIFVRVPARRRVELFYDDYCNLCKGTVRTLRTLDVSGAIVFRPASTSAPAAESLGIDAGELSVSIHGAFGGRVCAGYDLYVLLARRMPLLWPVAPALWLGRLTGVGPRLYGLVAANRRRLFGTCKVAYDVNNVRQAHFPLPTSHFRLELISAAFALLFIATLAFQIPYGGHEEKRVIEDPPLYKRVGFGVPDVFNATDLRMGDQWQVIYRDAGDGTWALVPLNAPDGSKLAYARYVDILYFGNSLRWRRLALEYDPVEFNQPGGKGYELTQRAIAFDDRLNGRRGGRYRVEVYRGFGSDPRRSDGGKYVPQLVHSYEVDRISSIHRQTMSARSSPGS